MRTGSRAETSSCRVQVTAGWQHKADAQKISEAELTLRVSRHDRNLRLSPISITLLIRWFSALMMSSIGTGAIFSPPAVMISSGKQSQCLSD